MVVTEGGAFIVTLNDLDEVPAVLEARTVNGKTPEAVGLPLSSPVEAPIVIPVGSAPLMTPQVMGAVPLAVRVSE